jgi:glycosyltransferase involved in cell wall biosynthesis
MSGARFSIVIAAFNAERTIGAAVRSVLAQTTGEFEVIVVDDGSNDGTASVVGGIGDPRVSVLLQENAGPAAARNAGIAASSGEYVGFLDSDDLLLPDYLGSMAAAFARAPNAGFAYTDAYVFESGSGRVRRDSAMAGMHPPAPPPGERDAFLLELLKRNFVYVAATVPRRVLDAVGGFDESLVGVADYDLWLRIVVAGYPAAWAPGLHALYRSHSAQMSGDHLAMNRDAQSLFRGIRLESLPSDEHRDVVRSRRTAIDRELRVLAGQEPLRSPMRRLRRRLGRVRRRMDLAHRWYDETPSAIAAAFGDLTSV